MIAHPRFFGSFALVTALALAAPPARSQCGPDGLDGGPCCASTFATVPAIPAMQTDARWLCFNGCQVTQNFLDCVTLGPVLPATGGGAVLCGVYNIRFRVKTCGTTNYLWNGSVKAFYSRTWQESSVVGAVNLQVWRFVVNGDLIPTPLLPTGPCRKPACTSLYTRIYFSGYIDYAFDCLSGGWQVAFALSHECDSIHHRLGTARPAPSSGLHPSRSFSIVGPGSTFVPSSSGTVRSDGPINAEAVRWNNWTPAPQACTFEEPTIGSFLALNEFCFCTATGPNQYIATFVNANGACGSSVAPDPVMPLMQKRIGGWTSTTQYPGPEFVLFDFGYLRYVNGCTATSSQEWFEGGETVGGFQAVSFTGLPLDPEFEDLGSCNNSTSNPAIRIGAPHVSNYLLNFNLP
jgi:hypothetical protein